METDEHDSGDDLKRKSRDIDSKSHRSHQDGLHTLTEWIDGAIVQIEVEGSIGNADQISTGFAWSLYHHTLELFSFLFPLTLAWSVPSYNRQREKLLKRSLGRLLLWGDGFRNGRLESVLNESEDLKETVIASLAAIGKVLLFKLAPRCLKNSIPFRIKYIRQEIQSLEILVEKAQTLFESDYESDTSNLTGYGDEENFPLEIITSLKTYIDCLMELLPSMEETLSSLDNQDFEEKLGSPLEFQVSGPAQPYVLKVYDKFAKAELRLIQRLGEANWQRHTSLRARDDQVPEEKQVQEIPKAIFTAVSMFHDSGLGSSLPAHSTYAATIASHSSFKSTAADRNNGDLRVPPTPKEVLKGMPFDCQICGHTLSRIRTRIDWRLHVFADLKPYICTFSGCRDELKTFPTRTLWEEHEFNQHRVNRHWHCSDCPSKFSTPELWRTHVKSIHKIELSDHQYPIAARSAEISEPQPIELQACPICLEVPGKSRRNFVTHVGKHMESIALAALPRDEELSDSESSTSSVGSLERQVQQDLDDFADPGSLLKDQPVKLSEKARAILLEHILSPGLPIHLSSSGSFIKKCMELVINGDAEISCLRDLEIKLLSGGKRIFLTPSNYLDFSLTIVRRIQSTVEFLSDAEQCLPQYLPYTNEYFVELVKDLQDYASNRTHRISINDMKNATTSFSDNKTNTERQPQVQGLKERNPEIVKGQESSTDEPSIDNDRYTSRDLNVPTTTSWSSFRELSPQNIATRFTGFDEPAVIPTVLSENSTLFSSAERPTTPSSSGLYQMPAPYVRAHPPANNQIDLGNSLHKSLLRKSGDISLPGSSHYFEDYSHYWNMVRTPSEQAYEDSIPSDFQDLLRAPSNPFIQSPADKPVICPAMGCEFKTTKKADFRGHWSIKHEPDIRRLLCGCCETGKSPIFKRLDKLKDHKTKHHNFTKDQRLKSCPPYHNGTSLDTFYFCSQDKMEDYRRRLKEYRTDDDLSKPSS